MLKFSKTELFVRNTHSQLDFSSFEYQIIIFFYIYQVQRHAWTKVSLM